METIRHKFNLYWKNKIVIAPREFEINGHIYFVHIIDSYCTKVMIFTLIKKYQEGYGVALHSIYKLYSNTKGLYFNFNKKRVYIGE